MTPIRDEISKTHLLDYPAERPAIAALSTAFHINWARSRTAYNTSMSIYIIAPNTVMRDAFGFSSELALFVNQHDAVQNRTMQAIKHFLEEEPINGRCDRSLFFFVVRNPESKQKVIDYIAEFDPGWIPVILTFDEVQRHREQKWGIRSLVAAQLFTRDLFDTQLPVRADIEFFGRDADLFDFTDAIKRGQNRGLFGLRKTGKNLLSI